MSETPTIATRIVAIGPWDHEGAPHGRPLVPAYERPLSVVWADPERTVPVAVVDEDGCRADVITEPASALRSTGDKP